jgi:sigma-B regulation protein RsbU (phosphoserine phosphatase)
METIPTSDDQLRFLRQSKMFENAPKTLLADIGRIATTVSVKADERIMEKGDEGTTMYIIVDGQVRIHDDDLTLTHLGQGDVFGEMAALDSEVRSASVTAEVDTTLFQLEQSSVYDVLSRRPEAARAFIHLLCQREKSIVHDVTERSFKVRALERELEIGRDIQAKFLSDTLPEVPGWEIAACLEPAREVAGDFYDAFHIRTINRIGLLVGDVCGKGVGASLFMTLFRSLIRATSLSGDFTGWATSGSGLSGTQNESITLTEADRQTLEDSVTLTNNYVAWTHGNTSMFASLFFALLDPESGSLVYINAGHEEPVIFGANEGTQRLAPTGPVVGIFPNAEFKIRTARLEPNDVMVVFTDGVTEAANVAGARYNEGRLLEFLVRTANRPPKTLLNEIMTDIEAFSAGAQQFDDITLLAVRRTS